MANNDNCTALIKKMTPFCTMTKFSRDTTPYRNHKNEINVPVKMIGNGKPMNWKKHVYYYCSNCHCYSNFYTFGTFIADNCSLENLDIQKLKSSKKIFKMLFVPIEAVVIQQSRTKQLSKVNHNGMEGLLDFQQRYTQKLLLQMLLHS